MSKYKISIVGAGNLATNLAIALEGEGYEIQEVFSRTFEKARKLATKLKKATPVCTEDFSKSKSFVFFLAVADNALPEIANSFTFPENALVAHTSGAVPLSALSIIATEKGVFYPLQTFSLEKIHSFRKIPILIEAYSVSTEKILTEIALSLTSHIFYFDSPKRKTVHLAAVFASNFVNRLLAFAAQVLEKDKAAFQILKELTLESVNKAFEVGPETAQTGPASRGDAQTIETHLHMLEAKPELQAVYKLISKQIPLKK